ncbi:hypothetical protein H5T51_01540 [Candidatus Bathyarchaeota archaeon]|nr:hypothetical protein [Candidatus Bathyarchaeota archaeon]
MGRYWLSSPFVIVDGTTGRKIGRIALKRKRDDVWNVVLCVGKRQIYLTQVKLSEDLTWNRLVKLLPEERLIRVCPTYQIWDKPSNPRYREDELPAKGFKLIDTPSGLSVWVRKSRKRRAYTLCLCQGFRIVRRLKYLNHIDVANLKYLADSRDIEGIRRALSRLGLELPKPRWSVEDEGWGGVIQEQLENGTFEEELWEAIENGDRERVQWLLNSPEDARMMGVSEDIIRWAFGEDDEE